MSLTTTEARFIIVLGIVISLLPISWILLQDSYHVRFKQKTVNKWEKEPINQRGSSWNKCAQPINLFSDSILDAISNSNSNHSHCCKLLQECNLWQWLCVALGEDLISRCVAQLDLYISRHMCRKIVLHCYVCNCSSAVDSILYTRDQSLWIGKHLRDGPDAELIYDMRDLGESHAAYCNGIEFCIGHGLGSRHLGSRSPVDGSSQGDDQSTCWIMVIRASSIVWIYIPSNCALFSFYF